MRINRKQKRGAVSILAILFVCLFAVLATSFTAMSNINLQTSQSHRDMVQSQAAAESGLAYIGSLLARYIAEEQPASYEQAPSQSEMMEIFTNFQDYAASALDGSDVIDGENVGALGAFNEDGLTGRQFSIPAIRVSSGRIDQFSVLLKQYDDTRDTIEVVSEGVAGDIERSVVLSHNISKDLPGLFDFALFSKEGLTFNNGVTVDGYNFEDDDDVLKIGTNGTDAGSVELKNSATVEGDVIVGPGGDVDEVIELGAGAEITGDRYPMPDNWDPPLVEVPDALQDSPSLGAVTGTGTIMTSGRYDSITLGNNEVLTIEGDVQLYVRGDINLKQSAQLKITPTGRLTLFLAGELNVFNSAKLNNLTEDPAKLMILGLDRCDKLDLKNSGIIYASIYVPHADVDLKNSSAVYGSLVTDDFRQHESADFHYDANLRDVNPVGVRGYISITPAGNSYYEL